MKIVRNLNSPKEATLTDGRRVYRKDYDYLPSHHTTLPYLQTAMHFCFRDGRMLGSTLMCTCGSAGIVVGYEAYRRWQSKYIGAEVIACHNFIQYGVHADGSHE